MSDQATCGQCGAPISWRQAGLAKESGKPYDTFYKCKGCGFSEKIPNTAPQKQGSIKKPVNELEVIKKRLGEKFSEVDAILDSLQAQINDLRERIGVKTEAKDPAKELDMSF